MPDGNETDIRELLRAIGRLEGKIESMLVHTSTLHAENKDLKVKHEHLLLRIGKIETRMNMYAGAVAVLTPILFIALETLTDKVFG